MGCSLVAARLVSIEPNLVGSSECDRSLKQRIPKIRHFLWFEKTGSSPTKGAAIPTGGLSPEKKGGQEVLKADEKVEKPEHRAAQF